MTFGKKKEPEITHKEKETPSTSKKEAASKSDDKPAAKKLAGERKLVSFHPSTRKAIVSVDGKETHVTYDVSREGVARIGLTPGEPSISVDDWLAGKVELKGLHGPRGVDA